MLGRRSPEYYRAITRRANPTASLRACDMILARAMPAASKHVEDRTVRIILEKHEIQRIEAADREMEIVNAQIQDDPA